jgi:hypothetical protein
MVRFAPRAAVASSPPRHRRRLHLQPSTGFAANSHWLSLGWATTSDHALAVDGTSPTLYIARSGPHSGVAVSIVGTADALAAVSGSPCTAGTAPYGAAISMP